MFELETDKIKFENFSIGRKYEKRNACSLNDPILDTQFTKIIEKILLGVKNGWMVQEGFRIRFLIGRYESGSDWLTRSKH